MSQPEATRNEELEARRLFDKQRAMRLGEMPEWEAITIPVRNAWLVLARRRLESKHAH